MQNYVFNCYDTIWFRLKERYEKLQATAEALFYQLIYNNSLAKTNNFIFYNP